MTESQCSGRKTAEPLRVLNATSFQASILALDAALNRSDNGIAFCAAADEIRSLTCGAAQRLAFPSDQAAPAPQFAALTQRLYDLLDRLRAAPAAKQPASGNGTEHP